MANDSAGFSCILFITRFSCHSISFRAAAAGSRSVSVWNIILMPEPETNSVFLLSSFVQRDENERTIMGPVDVYVCMCEADRSARLSGVHFAFAHQFCFPVLRRRRRRVFKTRYLYNFSKCKNNKKAICKRFRAGLSLLALGWLADRLEAYTTQMRDAFLICHSPVECLICFAVLFGLCLGLSILTCVKPFFLGFYALKDVLLLPIPIV